MYAGADDFVTRTLPFIRAGVDSGEAVLVVVAASKIRALRDALGPEADAVRFADMADVGRNPARIISAWRDFVDEQAAAGRRLRGIGEPIDCHRTSDELVECELHEALLNVAFDDSLPWWLLCPYDTESLPATVIHEAKRNHPYVAEGDTLHAAGRPSGCFRTDLNEPKWFDLPLGEPPAGATELEFDASNLADVRALVFAFGAERRLGAGQLDDLVLAVNEVAGNSIRHGGGRGSLRIWDDHGTVVCEVADGGRIGEPLVGRNRPTLEQQTGRGLWLANQLCDLVQLRSYDSGVVVRVHMAPG